MAFPSDQRRATGARRRHHSRRGRRVSGLGTEATAREVASEYVVADIIADGSFLDIQLLESMIEAVKSKKNIIWQGPPGTGKTWLARRLGWVLCNKRQSDRITLLQFHPSMSYEDFIRGFRPGSDGKLTLIDGPLLTASQNARQDSEHDYAVVIEEINRGNPAQIFREMLTLLDHDKRDPENALNLAYPRGRGRTVSSALEPARHRHDERRGPVPGPGRHSEST